LQSPPLPWLRFEMQLVNQPSSIAAKEISESVSLLPNA
jgi:hypothetical protein